MKKYLLILAIVSYAINSRAAVNLKTSAVKSDSTETNKKIKDLNSDIADLKTQLVTAQAQVPIDSIKLVVALSKSHDAQEDSRKAAKDAVGGDVGDAKKAEKLAKKASDATSDANDADKQLKKDRKKVKSLNKDIAKKQKKWAALQSSQSN